MTTCGMSLWSSCGISSPGKLHPWTPHWISCFLTWKTQSHQSPVVPIVIANVVLFIHVSSHWRHVYLFGLFMCCFGWLLVVGTVFVACCWHVRGRKPSPPSNRQRHKTSIPKGSQGSQMRRMTRHITSGRLVQTRARILRHVRCPVWILMFQLAAPSCYFWVPDTTVSPCCRSSWLDSWLNSWFVTCIPLALQHMHIHTCNVSINGSAESRRGAATRPEEEGLRGVPRAKQDT